MITLYTSEISTPIGEMLMVTSSDALYVLEFGNKERIEKHLKVLEKEHEITEGKNAFGEHVESQLEKYFKRELTEFDIPVVFEGSSFQQSVWEELLNVPYGTTRSYLQQSKHLGDVKAIRAVASANGQNRISIVVPCHRIVGTDGQLTGYAGEIWRKRYLLDLESNQISLFS